MGIRNSEGYTDLVPYHAIANIDREKKAEMKSAFRPLVYICAPYVGEIDKYKQKAVKFAQFAYKKGCIPMTPHLLFSFMNHDNKNEHDLALHMNIVLMGKCQEV